MVVLSFQSCSVSTTGVFRLVDTKFADCAELNSCSQNLRSLHLYDSILCSLEFILHMCKFYWSTNLKTPVHRFAGRLSQKKGRQFPRMRVHLNSKPMEFNTLACKLTTFFCDNRPAISVQWIAGCLTLVLQPARSHGPIRFMLISLPANLIGPCDLRG